MINKNKLEETLKSIKETSKLMGLSNEDFKKSYEKRKIGRIEPLDNGGIGVSTVNSPDMGYETALLDMNGTHPVERYKTKKDAITGHAKWLVLSKKVGNIVELGAGIVPDRIVKLFPVFSENQLDIVKSFIKNIKKPEENIEIN